MVGNIGWVTPPGHLSVTKHVDFLVLLRRLFADRVRELALTGSDIFLCPQLCSQKLRKSAYRFVTGRDDRRLIQQYSAVCFISCCTQGSDYKHVLMS